MLPGTLQGYVARVCCMTSQEGKALPQQSAASSSLPRVYPGHCLYILM